MLIPEDESLFHQTSQSFADAATSDHRFYDRYFLCSFAPDGSASAMLGMGVYKNMNVIDAFACIVIGRKQYNIRASRPLRPDYSTKVGPISCGIIEPLRKLRFTVEPNRENIALDMVYHAEIDPFLEGRWEGNARIVNGRVAYDTQRFDGIGHWDGWIEIDGKRIDVVHWCGGRDHSWGVRNGVGGFEPVNGPSEALSGEGFFLGYFQFGDASNMNGYCLWTENGDGTYRSLEGAVRWHEKFGRPDLRLVGLEKNVTFTAGRRQYESVQLKMELEDGSILLVEGTQAITGTILKGYGGHGEGFKDKKGFGVYRGDLLESDVYDLDSPEMMQLPMETPLKIRINGEDGFHGWGTVLATGELSQYGLKAQNREELQRYGIATFNVAQTADEQT